MQMTLRATKHDGTQWNVAAFHLFAKMSLIKDRTQETTHLAFMQSSQYSMPWPISSSIFTLIITYVIIVGPLPKNCPFQGETNKQTLGLSFLTDTRNLSQNYTSPSILRSQYNALPGHSILLSELQTLLIISKTHILLLKIHNASLLEKVFNRTFMSVLSPKQLV